MACWCWRRSRRVDPIVIKILIGIAALGLGIWLGLPGRYEQTVDELDESLGSAQRRTKHKKRAVNPLAWVQRKTRQSELRTRGQRGREIRLESPDPKK